MSTEDDVEVRRLSVTNHSDRPREIEVTSYAEVVLGPPADDLAALTKCRADACATKTRDCSLSSPEGGEGWGEEAEACFGSDAVSLSRSGGGRERK